MHRPLSPGRVPPRPRKGQSVSEGFERGLPPGAPLPLRASAGRASRGVLPGATPLLVTGTLQKPEGFTWTTRRCVETKGRHRQITVSSRTGATRIEVWSGHQKQPFPISRSRLALPSAGSPSGSARYPIEFNRRWLRWSRSQIWPCMSSVVAPSGSPARLLARSERSREIPREQRSAIRRGRRRLG